MDAKYFIPSKFTVDKKYYIYYFIDERIKAVFCYIYDKLSTENAIDDVKRIISDFKKIFVIKITPIRTDSDSEFINSHCNNQKSSVEENTFTQLLTYKDIVHQTTPVSFPQSNGKIERFNQNYTKLFVFEEKILYAFILQNKINE